MKLIHKCYTIEHEGVVYERYTPTSWAADGVRLTEEEAFEMESLFRQMMPQRQASGVGEAYALWHELDAATRLATSILKADYLSWQARRDFVEAVVRPRMEALGIRPRHLAGGEPEDEVRNYLYAILDHMGDHREARLPLLTT